MLAANGRLGSSLHSTFLSSPAERNQELCGNPNTVYMELADELSDLKALLSAFEFRGDWFLADLVLLGYCVEAEESAEAMELLLSTPQPHRALPLVRTAFESAQQGLVLATHENYGGIGARAWVHYQRRVARVIGEGIPARVSAIFDDRLGSMSKAWRNFYNEAHQTIDTARCAVEDYKKKPDNWLGSSFLPRQEKAYEMLSQALRKPDIAKAGSMNRSLYAALSLETHAAPRIQPSEIHIDTTGAILVKHSVRDLNTVRANARSCVAMSIRELVWSLNWRAALAAT